MAARPMSARVHSSLRAEKRRWRSAYRDSCQTRRTPQHTVVACDGARAPTGGEGCKQEEAHDMDFVVLVGLEVFVEFGHLRVELRVQRRRGIPRRCSTRGGAHEHETREQEAPAPHPQKPHDKDWDVALVGRTAAFT